jgi:gluconate kinase
MVFIKMQGSPLDERVSWEELYHKLLDKVPQLKSVPDCKKWFFNNERNGWLFDPMLAARCFRAYKDMINLDRDHFILVIGVEGSGKSTISIQMASWIDPNFCNENICFSAEEYISRLKSVEKGSCLVLDEAGTMLFSREAMSSNNIQMTKLFMLQRQKNVSVIVVCPSLWNIDSYIRNHRVNTLIRVWKQGHYMGYLPRAIGIINTLQQTKKQISAMKLPNGSFWHGCFRKKFPKSIDLKQYLKKKRQNFEDFADSLDTKAFEFVPIKQLANKLSINSRQINFLVDKGEIKVKKIGTKLFVSKEEYNRVLNIE